MCTVRHVAGRSACVQSSSLEMERVDHETACVCVCVCELAKFHGILSPDAPFFWCTRVCTEKKKIVVTLFFRRKMLNKHILNNKQQGQILISARPRSD